MLAEIRTFTHNYTLPEDACASYSLLYRMLDEFENDLHIHVHLENNILFPKARTL
jgi:regulator of cell morphogenesis and NO signaling